MTNLEALRTLPAEYMAEVLTDQRLVLLEFIPETIRPELDETRDKIKAMFLVWLNKEYTP